MKKLTLLAVAGVFSLTLSACGDSTCRNACEETVECTPALVSEIMSAMTGNAVACSWNDQGAATDECTTSCEESYDAATAEQQEAFATCSDCMAEALGDACDWEAVADCEDECANLTIESETDTDPESSDNLTCN